MRTQKSNQGGAITITSVDVPGVAVGLDQDYGYAVQAIWTGGTLAGTVKLQASIDGVTWSDVTGTSQAVSGAGNFLWNVNGAFYAFVRAYFVYSSGSGAITYWTLVKGP